ncbi:hypothetical protein [Mycobacteroides abscessus]|uniref:hypothetical protein n=1 Tax=Mycobacteroides abscessus TaxID=36809 RepID=UPI0019D012B8|nr:hypothetical protein [Mycobacteroides abscessus]MBN7483719.1 hypothetical protein [Mycobacteroides abscessus subsp. massiliense]
MSIKTFSVAAVAAGFVMFPLAACGSGTPVATTVTATPTTAATTSSSSCTISSGYENWESCWKAEQRQHPTTTARPTAAAPAHAKSSGLPWWAWLLIVPVGLAALFVLGIKLSEMNDERRVARAWQKVDELDARAARRATRVLDYDDYEDDDELDDDELDEEGDMDFLHRVTDPAPAPAAPAPPAGGNLLSSLRQQGGAQ